MKKIFFAVLAIAAMMVSCKKEGLVDIQKETPTVETNELQPVVLGSNLFNAAATKVSVNDMNTWKADGKNIYVYALNLNPAAVYPVPEEDQDAISKVFIDNVAATLSGEYADLGTFTGSLDLKDPANNNPFYYGVSDADIYDFYAYYLGYNLGDDNETKAKYENGVITVTDVNITGNNDIMIAETDKAADAVVEGTMVNPKYLYSQYSARHGVKPNLVFNHMLSKFTFNVRYAGNLPEGSKIELTGVTFDDAIKSGKLVLNGDASGFIANDVDESDDVIAITPAPSMVLNPKTDEDPYGYQPAGNLMVFPAGTGSYNLVIDFKQTFADMSEKEFGLNEEIKPADVVVDDAGTTATSFEAGKHYVVNITVYGLEEVKVDVQLTKWEDAGTVTIDPDQKENGIMKQVSATVTIGEEAKNCTLYAEVFEAGNEVYCLFADESKLVLAPAGTYTVDNSTVSTGIASIVIGEGGVITTVTPVSE